MSNDYFGMDRAFPEFKLSPIQQLAKEMGVTESELQGFVNCLRVWTDKGYTLEEAIAKNQGQIMRMLSVVHNLPTDDKKAFVVDTFFPS